MGTSLPDACPADAAVEANVPLARVRAAVPDVLAACARTGDGTDEGVLAASCCEGPAAGPGGCEGNVCGVRAAVKRVRAEAGLSGAVVERLEVAARAQSVKGCAVAAACDPGAGGAVQDVCVPHCGPPSRDAAADCVPTRPRGARSEAPSRRVQAEGGGAEGSAAAGKGSVGPPVPLSAKSLGSASPGSPGVSAYTDVLPRPSWLWHRVDEGCGPPAQAGHAVVADSGRLFVFGGLAGCAAGSRDRRGEGRACDRAASSPRVARRRAGNEGRAPAAVRRSSPAVNGGVSDSHEAHADDVSIFAQVAGSIVDRDLGGSRTNGLHQYDPEARTWETLSAGTCVAGDRSPCPRSHASMAMFGGSLFVFGGFDANGTVLGDFWEFIVSKRRWRAVPCTGALQSWRPVRRMHEAESAFATSPTVGASAFEDSSTTPASQSGAGGEGGPDAGGFGFPVGPGLSEVPNSTDLGNNGSRDADRPSSRPSTCSVPGPRAEHSAVVYGNDMIVFGGHDGMKKLNETFVFSFRIRQWRRPFSAELNAPSRRCKHSAVLYRKAMYVLGGYQVAAGKNFARSDFHRLDMETLTWSPVLASLRCPGGVQGHKSVVIGEKMYVLGGKILARRKREPSPLSCDVYVYSFPTNSWSSLQTSGAGPSPRHLHAVAAIPREHEKSSIFLCGGADKSKTALFRDLWELCDVGVDTSESVRPFCTSCSSNQSLVNNPKFSDVSFRVDNKTVYGHRCILYSRSDYFRSMLDSEMREQCQDQISIPGISFDAFIGVLHYLYCGVASLPTVEIAMCVLQAADMLGIDGLRLRCVERIEQSVSSSNVVAICELADFHNALRLKQYCVSFIIHNFKNVVSSDAWAALQKRDTSLTREVLVAFAEAVELGPAPSRKRQRCILRDDM